MPDTGVAPCLSVNVDVVIVEGSIASLNVAEISLLRGTAKTGLVETTRGGVVSGIGPVVKRHTKLTAKAWPDASLAPVVIVAVCALLAARLPDGAKVAVVPP
jgi:hypothetical protein